MTLREFDAVSRGAIRAQFGAQPEKDDITQDEYQQFLAARVEAHRRGEL